jgi:peptidoglycan/LPS O-acetylase OafA/YrhL
VEISSLHPKVGKTISHSIPLIDAIRGGSSLVVAISHVGLLVFPEFQKLFFFTGALSVDAFIIVSGFLMTLVLCGSGESVSLTRKSVLNFYVRRFFRIAPAFYLAYGASLFLEHTSLVNILLHLSFLNGIFPEYAGDSVIIPFWSISLEVQFYIIAPFFIAAVTRSPMLSLVLGSALTLVASQFWGIYGKPGLLGSFDHANFLPLSLGMFITGIILGLRYAMPQCLLSISASVSLILIQPFLHPFFLHSLVAAMASATILLITYFPPNLLGRWNKLHLILKNRVVGWSADFSYGLYLFHYFAIIWLGKYVCPSDWFGELPRAVAFGGALFFTLSVSYAVTSIIFRLVEVPAVGLGKRMLIKV